jgi:hypothetical protein
VQKEETQGRQGAGAQGKEARGRPIPVLASPSRGERGGLWLDIALVLALGLLVLAGFALAEWRRTGGQPGAPLDDVYIHYQYARNLATGRGFGFNLDQPTPGSTSPLWVLLLSGVYWLSGTLALPARLLSATAYLAVGALTAVLARQLLADRRAALIVGLLTVLSGRLAWAGMSGMETTLFCLVSLLGILRHDVEQKSGRPAFGSAALFGVASLLRPEGYLLFALAVLIRWRARWRQGEGAFRKSWLVQEAGAVALYMALVLPYLILSYTWTGHLLPNTFRVVSGDVLYKPLRYGREFVELIFYDHPLLTALLPVGLVALGRRCGRSRPLFLAWAVGLPLVSALFAPRLRHHGRYVIPLIPLYALLGVAGLVAVFGWWEKRVARQAVTRLARIGAALLVLGIALWGTVRWADQFAWNVDNINGMHVSLGRWVAENTSPSAVVAANDIGAIGFVSGREVIDTVGLVTPEVIDVLSPWDWAWKRDAALCRYLSYRDPDLVILLPNWYRFLSQNEQVLTPVHAVKLENNTIAGGDTMIVYAPDWPYVRNLAMDSRVDAELGYAVRLLGFDLAPQNLSPGSPVELTLYWESVQPVEAHYKVFVHLADETERIWGQHDLYPVGSMAPTFLWEPGDVVRDEHAFSVAPGAPPGTVRLMVGMYDETTMDRLPVVQGPDAGGGRVLLAELAVKQ